jgi:AraC family transcriptional regulator, regulatory protein of adaptative response / methylated-DNA-[protein]-cysteine methyltransferase
MTYYEEIAESIGYISNHFREHPSLEELAETAHMSPFHFQRIFTEWAGVSPKQFMGFLTVEALKEEILKCRNLIEAVDGVGLSSQSRAYDLMIHIEAVTPGEYKSAGRGVTMEYGSAETPFGRCLVVSTYRGVCAIQFYKDNLESLISAIRTKWHDVELREDNEMAADVMNAVFIDRNKPIHLLLRGTPFQIQVWKALISIPFGYLTTYHDLAHIIHRDSAVRAVASAVACNPVSLIIPCHRVIRNEGLVGQYHWGSEKKVGIIGWERARR